MAVKSLGRPSPASTNRLRSAAGISSKVAYGCTAAHSIGRRIDSTPAPRITPNSAPRSVEARSSGPLAIDAEEALGNGPRGGGGARERAEHAPRAPARSTGASRRRCYKRGRHGAPQAGGDRQQDAGVPRPRGEQAVRLVPRPLGRVGDGDGDDPCAGPRTRRAGHRCGLRQRLDDAVPRRGGLPGARRRPRARQRRARPRAGGALGQRCRHSPSRTWTRSRTPTSTARRSTPRCSSTPCTTRRARATCCAALRRTSGPAGGSCSESRPGCIRSPRAPARTPAPAAGGSAACACASSGATCAPPASARRAGSSSRPARMPHGRPASPGSSHGWSARTSSSRPAGTTGWRRRKPAYSTVA